MTQRKLDVVKHRRGKGINEITFWGSLRLGRLQALVQEGRIIKNKIRARLAWLSG